MTHDPTKLHLYLSHRAALVDYATPIVGSRAGAEDVVQEAYLRLDSVSEDRSVREPARYLYRIVRNLAIDLRRRLASEARVIAPATTTLVEQAAEDRPSPESHALDRDELRVLAEALAELPERTRLAVEMYRLGGYKLKDIAAELGVSVTTAHDLVTRGIAHCRHRVCGTP